jgi:hypothetical protein
VDLSLEETIRKKENAQAAFNVLNRAFYQSDSLTSFDIRNPNRITVEDLLLTIAEYQPLGAVELVYDMLDCEDLHIKFRVEAMMYYVDFSKEVPKQRQQLIKILFSDTRQRDYSGSKYWSSAKLNNLGNLTHRSLVTLEELLFATRTLWWTYQACKEISNWSNKEQFRHLIVSKIIETLQITFNKLMALKGGWFNTYQIELLVNVLIDFKLDSDEKSVLDSLFQLGIQHFQKNFADRSYRIVQLNHYRRQLGLLNATQEKSGEDAWNAMEKHWQQENIIWSIVAQQLIDTRVIPDMEYFENFGTNDSNISSGDFLSLLAGDGSEEYNLCLFDTDYDEGYSDEAFNLLIGMLKNPLVTIRKISEGDEFKLPFIDLSDITNIGSDFDISRYQDTYYFECQKQHFMFRLSYTNIEEQIFASVYTFNNFLKQLGRVERCYEIDMEDTGYFKGFFVADRFKYPEMQQYLRLPSWEVV